MKKASVYLLLICLLSSCSLKYNYEVNPYDVMGVIDDNGEYISEYLFPSSYEDYSSYPISRNQMYRCVAAYNQQRGVFKTSFHLFRHTFAKNWIVNGGDLYSLQRMLGHSTLDMVTKYANLYGEDLKPKVEDYSLLSTTTAKPRGRMIQRRSKRK